MPFTETAPPADRTQWDGVSARQATDYIDLGQWNMLRAAVAALLAGAPTRVVTKRTVTGNYTLVLADGLDITLHSTAAGAHTITLPSDASVAIPQEVQIPWRQYGAGQITFAAGSGAVVQSAGNALKSAAQYAEGYVTKVAANTWVVSGYVVV